MKVKLLVLCSVILLSSNFLQASDIVRASHTHYAVGKQKVSSSPTIKIRQAPATSKSNIKVENKTGHDDFTPAFRLAARLLTDAISEDYPLTVHIKFGTEGDFDASTTGGDFLAITKTNFVLNDYVLRNPNTESSDRNRQGRNMLIPQTLANREYLGDLDPLTPDMEILLNTSYESEFYTDTLNTNIDNDQYDLTTLILRGMVAGCGFSSSFSRVSVFDPDDVILGNKTIASNGIAYPYLFDKFVQNENGVFFSDVANSTSDIQSFLTGNKIYFGDHNYPIAELRNILFSSTNRSDLDLSNINLLQDTTELMCADFYSGTIIRSITPKTKNILEKLGWGNDVITSLRYQTCNIIPALGLPPITMPLQPNQYYYFTHNMYDRYPYISIGQVQYFDLCLLKPDGEFYTLIHKYNTEILDINYSSLPNYEWQRDPETGAVIGYLFFKSFNPLYVPQVNASEVQFSGFKKILLAYAPTTADIQVEKKNVTATSMDAKIDFSSYGGTSHRINYSISGDPTQYYIDKPNKEDVTHLLQNLPTNRKTSIWVAATNSMGSVNSPTITIGEDPISAMSLVVTKTGTNLKYRFKLGTEYVTDLTINSVQILDTYGVLKMTVNAGINESFSISSLPPGYYLIKVDVVGSTVFTKMFSR